MINKYNANSLAEHDVIVDS